MKSEIPIGPRASLFSHTMVCLYEKLAEFITLQHEYSYSLTAVNNNY